MDALTPLTAGILRAQRSRVAAQTLQMVREALAPSCGHLGGRSRAPKHPVQLTTTGYMAHSAALEGEATCAPDGGHQLPQLEGSRRVRRSEGASGFPSISAGVHVARSRVQEEFHDRACHGLLRFVSWLDRSVADGSLVVTELLGLIRAHRSVLVANAIRMCVRQDDDFEYMGTVDAACKNWLVF